jgi:hypothetical protein
MKAWTVATAAGVCSFDSSHHWKEGDTVYRVSGSGWYKTFCPSCALQRHGAGVAPAVVAVTSQPVSAKPLQALGDQVTARLDVKRAQAHDEDEA